MGNKQEFLNKYADIITIACQGTKIFPSVKIAQAALETGWGTSFPGNNMFGIKATGSKTQYWHGESVSSRTHEIVNGTSVQITSAFRKYDSVSDSIRDHNLLLYNQNYKTVIDAETPEEQCRALQSCGYATGTNYANSLISIIKSNDLEKYDKKKVL